MFGDDEHLLAPNTEILGAGLVLFCVLGVAFDLHRWVVYARPPSLAVVYIPSMSVSMIRRVLVSEEKRRPMPATWWMPLCVYYVAITMFAVFRGLDTSSERWLAAFAVLHIAAILFRAYLDHRKATANELSRV